MTLSLWVEGSSRQLIRGGRQRGTEELLGRLTREGWEVLEVSPDIQDASRHGLGFSLYCSLGVVDLKRMDMNRWLDEIPGSDRKRKGRTEWKIVFLFIT